MYRWHINATCFIIGTVAAWLVIHYA